MYLNIRKDLEEIYKKYPNIYIPSTKIKRYLSNIEPKVLANILTNITLENKLKYPSTEKIYKKTKKQLFKNLVEYEPNYIDRNYKLENSNSYVTDFIKPEYEDKNLIIYLKEDEYQNINILTDYFTEDIRIKCKRVFKEKNPEEMWKDKKSLWKIYMNLLSKNVDITGITLRDSVFKTTSECNTFRITVVLSSFYFFKPTRILDPSAGWGDRLLAAIAYSKNNKNFKYYHGIDPNKDLFPKYHDIIDTFVEEENRTKFNIIPEPFEEVVLKNKYDLIYSSPPFFVLEDYGYYKKTDDKMKQSIEKFKTVEDWFNGFLLTSYVSAFEKLVPGGYMVLNLEDTFGQTRYTEAFILAFTGLVQDCNFLGTFSYFSEDAQKYRPQWVWKKEKAKDDKNNIMTLFKKYYPNFYHYLFSN